MRVLVACEFSGIVRDAFKARGHDAWSCDLLPTEKPGNHIQGDCLEAIKKGWDLMIAHPPCTYLSYAATKYWNDNGRPALREKARTFFMALLNCKIPKRCIENPVGWINTLGPKPEQIIEPFYFGEPQRKRTCLWLRGLPHLEHYAEPVLWAAKTHVAPVAIYTDKNGKKLYFTDAMHGGHQRSLTFQSIANAMAE